MKTHKILSIVEYEMVKIMELINNRGLNFENKESATGRVCGHPPTLIDTRVPLLKL